MRGRLQTTNERLTHLIQFFSVLKEYKSGRGIDLVSLGSVLHSQLYINIYKVI